MSSSISNSEGRAFLRTFLRGSAGLTALVVLLLILIDPFGTGRLTPFNHTVTFDTGPRKAHAVRLRDPRFNSVIIGNSTMQLIQPRMLDQLTGLSFVQLTVPGSGAQEQNALVATLIRERGDAIRALVIGLDYGWCDPTRESRVLPGYPFPFWLYDPSPATYALGLLRLDSLEAVPRRIGLMLGRGATARPDGYWDYELLPTGAAHIAPKKTVDLKPQPGARQSAAQGLATLVAKLPADAAVVLVFPPVFVPEDHRPDRASEDAKQRCKAELSAVVAARRRGYVVDRWIDDAMNRDPRNFIDHNHFRAPLARAIEADIAKALANK